MRDLFTVESSVLPDDTRVIGFQGTEGLSQLFRFEIFLSISSEDAEDFDMADAMGAKASLVFDRDSDDKQPLYFSGIFATMEHVLEVSGRAFYRAELVPHLFQLTQTLHSRIFTKQSLPDIVKEVLEDGGLTSDDYALRLEHTYSVEEHVCQYQESDFDFLSRWLEREGIYYFFEHSDEGDKLILTDNKSAHEPLRKLAVPYHPVAGADMSAGESFSAFTCKHSALPASVRLKDYDYLKPTLDVVGSAPVSNIGLGEISVYGSRFFTPDEGKRLATIRAEELLAGQVVFHGEGTPLHIRSGYLFEVEDHPRGAFNTTYVATAVRHVGNQGVSTNELKKLTGIDQGGVYHVEVSAVAETVQYRAPRRAAWPRIYGFENGVVDGEVDSDYAQIDDQGRYAVKFKFDESALKDGRASTWVRMLQPHGGGVEGWHFPLRKNTEVLFTFLGGDPDRPVIAGVVPNAHTPSPVTSSNHTTNIIHTGGGNRLEMEDEAGSQRVTLSTPTKNTFLRMGAPNDDKNLFLSTDGMAYVYVGEDFHDRTIGNKEEWVNQSVTEHYEGPFKTYVQKDVYQGYNANFTEEVCDGQVTEHYKAHETNVTELRKSWVGGEITQTYDKKHETTIVSGGRVQTVTGLFDQTLNTGLKQTVIGPVQVTVTGDVVETISGTFTQTTAHSNDFWTGNKSSHTYGLHSTMNFGAKAAINLSASAELNLSASVVVSAGLKLEAKASASVTTSAVCDINLGSTVYNNKTLKFDKAGCGIKDLGIALHCAGIEIFS